MSRSIVAILSLSALWGLAACGGGGDVCQKYADDFEACDGDSYSVEACEAEIAACNDADRQIVDDFFSCAKDAGLFECDPELTNPNDAYALLAAIEACATPLSGLSQACQTSSGFGTFPTI